MVLGLEHRNDKLERLNSSGALMVPSCFGAEQVDQLATLTAPDKLEYIRTNSSSRPSRKRRHHASIATVVENCSIPALLGSDHPGKAVLSIVASKLNDNFFSELFGQELTIHSTTIGSLLMAPGDFIVSHTHFVDKEGRNKYLQPDDILSGRIVLSLALYLRQGIGGGRFVYRDRSSNHVSYLSPETGDAIVFFADQPHWAESIREGQRHVLPINLLLTPKNLE